MKPDEIRAKNEEIFECTKCKTEYSKELDFVSCNKAACYATDICKDCRSDFFVGAYYCFEGHVCKMKENEEMVCDACNKLKKTKFWICDVDEND